MNSRMRRTAATGLALWSMMAIAAFAQRRSPGLISPDGSDEDGRVATGCPTFSWTLVSEATGYELRVYEARPQEEMPASAAPRLRKEFPDGATSWTPALSQCLPPGRYGWAVAALAGEGEPRWSQPGLFEVAATPPRAPTAPERRQAAPLVLAGPPSSSTQAWVSPDGNPRQVSDEAYVPPSCGSGKFADVPAGSPFCRWIEQLDRDGVMSSCDGGANFCPDNPVTRQQLAMFLGMSMRGTATWHPAQGSNWLAPPADNVATTVLPSGVGPHTSITIGVDGLPIISSYDAASSRLRVTHCDDVACAPGGEISTVLNDPHASGQYSSITIGRDGLPVISYYDYDISAVPVAQALKVAHCNDLACAGQDETITAVDDPGIEAVGLHTSIAIGADGFPIVSYHDFSAGTLKLVRCDDVACSGTGETKQTLHAIAGHIVGEYSSIAIGGFGWPIISYYDATDQDLRVWSCIDAACTFAGQGAALDTADDAGRYTSATIGSDGLPIISYGESHSIRGVPVNSLRVAHCNDPRCTGLDETISSASFGGQHSSITIGADGLPIISHYEGVLLVTRCGDVTCGGTGTTTNVVDRGNGNDVGQYSSITIGADGLPIISYYDATAGALKVMHCANVSCAPYFRRR